MPTPTTAGRGYELPHQTNPLETDVYRIIAAFEAIDTDIVALFEAIGGVSDSSDAVKLLGDQLVDGIKTFMQSPVIPTPTAGDNSTKAATTAFVQAAIASLVASSPAALDTLNELATALGNDPNFATTIATQLGLKAPLESPAFTGTPTVPTAPSGTNTTQAASTAFVKQAVDPVSAAVAAIPLIPAGGLMPYAGSAAPTGWLLCAGQAVSRTTYAALFTAIGTTYGVGDGSTTFNLPDLRGRTIAGKDNMEGTAANRLTSGGSGITGTTLGAAGGAETHTLTSAQIPAHTHTGSTDTAGSHSHEGGVATSTFGGSAPTASVSGSGAGATTSTAGAHSHTVTINANTGGGGAHNNTQPTIVLNYIIKT